MTRGQSRAQDIVERVSAVMSLDDIASKTGLTTAEVQAARDGRATPAAVAALDSLGDQMDRDYALQNR